MASSSASRRRSRAVPSRKSRSALEEWCVARRSSLFTVAALGLLPVDNSGPDECAVYIAPQVRCTLHRLLCGAAVALVRHYLHQHEAHPHTLWPAKFHTHLR